MKTVLKVLTALAAIAGTVYVIATYGDKIVAWAKKMLGKCDCCGGECNCEGECTCGEECTCDEECTCQCECTEEAAAEECCCAAAEEAPAEECCCACTEEAPVADEADFEG